MTKATDVMAEIALASREQATGIEQVNEALTSMDEATQQNAAMVEEATAASQSLLEGARGLDRMLSRFKIGAPDAADSVPVSSRASAAAARKRA